MDARAGLLAALGLDVQISSWHATHPVDADWIVRHLGGGGVLHPWGTVRQPEDQPHLAAKTAILRARAGRPPWRPGAS